MAVIAATAANRTFTSMQMLRGRLHVTRGLAAALCAGAATACAPSIPQPATAPARAELPSATDWTAYGHDAGGSKYSPARQITRANVTDLVPVWTYRTGDFARGGGTVRDETTPLFVDGVLYVSTPFGGVRALDGESGRELWSFDSELDLSANYGDPTNRGVSTWLDQSGAQGTTCRRRIYVATLDARLIALDGRTGAPCADFGSRGEVDLSRGLRNHPQYKGELGVTSPPAVVGNLLVVGSAVADNRRANAPAGVVRAFDARTGELRWSWDPVPRSSGDSAFDSWHGATAHETGAANAWSIISADAARDLVFVPTGSASPDFFGGQRLGRDDYANSVVALRASTGAVVWHFQLVHHDLWDYDVPAEPVLVTLHRGGKEVPALVQGTKMGYVYVLNRETGAPIFPVEERAAPASDVPGEQAWPTQPVPTLPAPLGPTQLKEDDIFALNDSSRAWCQARLAGARNEGIFTPPSTRGTVIFPGNIGGSNWSGVAVDQARNIAIVPSNRIVTMVELIPRADLHGRSMGGTRFDEFAAQSGTPYGLRRIHLIAPDGVPCNRPPWGVLTAIDLESGATRWTRPFGSIAGLAGVPESATWGSPNLGGAMVTGSGIVFAGGAVDQRLHAFDVDTGDELWSAVLPAGVHGSPMTYVTSSGEQLVVVSAGGHRELRDRVGDYIVAFALKGRHAAAAVPPAAISSGRYTGHVTLDRSRLALQLELEVGDGKATVRFTTTEPHLDGQGAGFVRGDSLVIDANWTFAAQHCSGTMQLRGENANRGTALIGELEYFDGCADRRTKPGTFALRRSP